MAMIATYVQEGRVINYTPSSAVSAGDVVVLGDLVGVAPRDIAADALGSLTIAGVVRFPKSAEVGSAIAAGVKVYWDVADAEAKEDDESGANKMIGYTIAATVDADTTVLVRLER